eukprot:2337782-Rhodomonas_salina.3
MKRDKPGRGTGIIKKGFLLLIGGVLPEGFILRSASSCTEAGFDTHRIVSLGAVVPRVASIAGELHNQLANAQWHADTACTAVRQMLFMHASSSSEVARGSIPRSPMHPLCDVRY